MKELRRFNIFYNDFADILFGNKRALLFLKPLYFKAGDVCQFVEFDGNTCTSRFLNVRIVHIFGEFRWLGKGWFLVSFDVLPGVI